MHDRDLMNDAELSEIERRTYQVAISDGTADLVLGLGLLAVGVSWAIDGLGEPVLVFVSFILLIGLWKLLRKTVTEPRIGHVELHPRRMERLARGRRAVFYAFVLLPLALLPLVLVAPDWRPALSLFGQLGFGASVAAGGYLFEAKRLYAYGALLISLLVAARVAGIAHEYATITTGAVVTIVGLSLLAAFVRRHPVILPLNAYDV